LGVGVAEIFLKRRR